MPKLFLASIMSFAFFSHSVAWGSCATAKVTGSSCSNINLEFDVTQCQDSSSANPKIDCKETAATALLNTNKNTYKVSLKLEESWGEKTWKLVDDVKVLSKPRTSKSESRPKKQVPLKERETVVYQEPVLPISHLPGAAPLRECVPPIRETATEEKTAPSNPLSWSGYFDAYYAYNFGKPGTSAAPTSPATLTSATIPLRYYDRNHDQITLNLMELTLKKEASPIGFQADIGFGQWIDQNITTDEITKHLSQGFLTIAPKTVEGLTIQIGKMYTHMGLEVAHAQDNFNYSRSTTYGYALPFWHVGAKVNKAYLGGKLNTLLAVYNGWSVDSFDNNAGKTFGASINGSPLTGLTLFYNVITGPESRNNSSKVRTVHDFIATWEVIPMLTVAADFVLGQDKEDDTKQTWTTFELLAKIKPHDAYWIAPRFEYYQDADGVTTGTTQKLTSLTLTNTFDWGHGFETRFEYRYDKSDQTVFLDGGSPSDKQHTLSLSALYRF